MKRLWKKKWLIPVGVVALVLLIIGIAIPVLAASGNSNTNSYGNGYIDGPTMTRLAGVLGLSPSDLNSQLASGKTLAALAQEHNVADSALVDTIVAPYADQLATQVKYNYLTQDQADNLLSNAKSQANSLLQQDMSKATANSNNSGSNNFFENCLNFMRGRGWGGMGPGMMQGWGFNNNNPGATPNASPSTGNSYGGWGPGGMMGRW